MVTTLSSQFQYVVMFGKKIYMQIYKQYKCKIYIYIYIYFNMSDVQVYKKIAWSTKSTRSPNHLIVPNHIGSYVEPIQQLGRIGWVPTDRPDRFELSLIIILKKIMIYKYLIILNTFLISLILKYIYIYI